MSTLLAPSIREMRRGERSCLGDGWWGRMKASQAARPARGSRGSLVSAKESRCSSSESRHHLRSVLSRKMVNRLCVDRDAVDTSCGQRREPPLE
jgi:hypothetical protein